MSFSKCDSVSEVLPTTLGERGTENYSPGSRTLWRLNNVWKNQLLSTVFRWTVQEAVKVELRFQQRPHVRQAADLGGRGHLSLWNTDDAVKGRRC